MGKKRVIKKEGEDIEKAEVAKTAVSKSRSKKKLQKATLFIQSTYNNTIITLSDEKGNVVFQSSAGSAGFSGSKKGTPYAASRAAGVVALKAEELGVEELTVRVKGISGGRESSLRVFSQKGFNINSIKDVTPIPHNIPRLPKPRRV
ncbi:30S ribosomal protein S11 [Patescibacteria group bacterium]